MADRSWLYEGVAKNENVDTSNPNWTHNIYGVSTWSDWMNEYNDDPENPNVYPDSEDPIINADGKAYARVRFTNPDTAKAVGERIIDEHYDNANGDTLRFATTYINGYDSEFDSLSDEFKSRTKNYSDRLGAWANYGEKKETIKLTMQQMRNRAELETLRPTLDAYLPKEVIDGAIERGIRFEELIGEMQNIELQEEDLSGVPAYELDTFSAEYGKRVAKNFVAGFGDVAYSIGGGLEYLGLESAEALTDLGKEVREKYGQQSDPRLFKGDTVTGDLFDAMKDGDFWLLDFPRLIPNIMTMFIPYMGGMKVVQGARAGLSNVPRIAGFFDKVSKSGKAGQFIVDKGQVIPDLIGGAYLGRQMESLMEAGGLYEDLVDQGFTKQEASVGAREVWNRNEDLFWLDAVQLGLAFAKVPNFIKGDMAKWYTTYPYKAGQYAVAGGTEGAEEFAQSYFQDLGKAYARDYDKLQPMEFLDYLNEASTNEEAKKSFALGFLSGGAFQFTGDMYNNLTSEDIDLKTAKQIINEVTEDYNTIKEVRQRQAIDPQEIVEGRIEELQNLEAMQGLQLQFFFSNRALQDEVSQKDSDYNLEDLVRQGLAEKTGEQTSDGQDIYRVKNIVGDNIIEDGKVKISLSGQASYVDIAEEIIEAVLKALGQSNPALANEIMSYVQEEQSRSPSNKVSGVELFSKALLYGNLGQETGGLPANIEMSERRIPDELADRFMAEFDTPEKGNVLDQLLDEEGAPNIVQDFPNPYVPPEVEEVQEDVNDEVEVEEESSGAVLTEDEADAEVIAERVKGTKAELFHKTADPKLKETVIKVLRKMKAEREALEEETPQESPTEFIDRIGSALTRGTNPGALENIEIVADNFKKSELLQWFKDKKVKVLKRDTKKVLIKKIQDFYQPKEEVKAEPKKKKEPVKEPESEGFPSILADMYAKNYSKADLIKIAEKQGVKVLKSDTIAKIQGKIRDKVLAPPKKSKKTSAKTVKKEIVKAIKKKPTKKKAPRKKKAEPSAKDKKLQIIAKTEGKGLDERGLKQVMSLEPVPEDVDLVEENVTNEIVATVIKELRIDPASPPYSISQSVTKRGRLRAIQMYYKNKATGMDTFGFGGSYSIAVLPNRPIPKTYAELDSLQKSVLRKAVDKIKEGGKLIIVSDNQGDNRQNLIDIMDEVGYADKRNINQELTDDENLVYDNMSPRATSVEFTREIPPDFPEDFETKEYEIGDGYRALDYFLGKASYSLKDREPPKQVFKGDSATLSDDQIRDQIVGRKTREEQKNIKNHKKFFGVDKFSDYYRTFSTQLRKIHPKLPSVFKKYQYQSRKYYNEIMEDFSPLIKVLKDLKKKAKGGLLRKADVEIAKDYIDIELALKNSQFDTPKAKELFEKYGITEPLKRARKRFEMFRRDFESVGMDIGYIENYVARSVNDYINLLAYMEANGKLSEKDRLRVQTKVEEISQESGKLLTDDQILKVVEDIIVGNGATNKNGSIDNGKRREILEINAEMNRYYADTFDALNIYAVQVSEKIMQRRFLGGSQYGVRKKTEKGSGKKYFIIVNKISGVQIKSEQFKNKSNAVRRIKELEKQDTEKKGSPHFDTKVLLDGMLFDLIKKYNLDPRQADRLGKLLGDYFTKGKGSPFWSSVRTAGHIATLMSGIFSTVTQIADLSLSVWRSGNSGILRLPTGFIRTTQAFTKAFLDGTPLPTEFLKNGYIAKEDYGIDSIAEEYTVDDGIGVNSFKFLSRILFFEFTDALGKNTTVNASLMKYRSAVRRPKSKDFAELNFRLDNMDFSQAEKNIIFDALSRKDFGEPLLKEFAYYELLNIQPVDKSEVPPYYLNSPGFGRLFYQLKTFMIKRWDVFWDETQMIRSKAIEFQNKGQTVKAYAGYTEMAFRMAMLGICLAMGESGIDRIKDWLAGRKPTPFTDLGVSNILKIFGLSKYNFYQFKREGLMYAMWKLVAPPSIGMAEDVLIKDIGQTVIAPYGEEVVKTIGTDRKINFKRGTRKVAKDIKEKGLKSVKYIPIFGKHLHWWDTKSFGAKPPLFNDTELADDLDYYIKRYGGGQGARNKRKYDKQKKGEVGKAFERVERKVKRSLDDLIK